MANVTVLPTKPRGIVKVFFKLPIYLFRWQLGWIFGHRFLMITHIGRKSGKRHQTVLEVIHYNPSAQEYFVVSGYGERSDWYQNIKKQSAVEVQVGNKHFIPKQRLLSSEETFQMVDEYRKENPLAFRKLVSFVGYPYDGSVESLRAISDTFRGVVFQQKSS